MKKRCKNCRRNLNISHYYARDDRQGHYAFCKTCMKKSPVVVTLGEWPDEYHETERKSRTLDWPLKSDRGYGTI